MFRLVNTFFAVAICATLQLYGQCPGGVSGSCDGSGSSLDLYWVGTTSGQDGYWNDPCSWRVGSINGVEPCQAPRSIDDVYITEAGLGSGGGDVTILTQARCRDLFVDSDVNSLPTPFRVLMMSPGFLEVYGSFTLQTNMTWSVVGTNTGPELFFKSNSAGNTIETRGHELHSVVFDGVGGEWQLSSHLRAGCMLFLFGEFNTNGYDMDLLTFSSHVNAGAAPANRIIRFNDSEVTIRGTAGNNRYTPYTNWRNPGAWESYNSNPSNTDFQAGDSKIIFTTTSPFIHLGGLSYNVIHHTGTGRFYDHTGNEPCYIDTLKVEGRVFFHHAHNFNVLELTQPSVQHDFFRHQWIATDFIVAGDACEPTTLSSEYNRFLHLPSSISSPMNGFIIDNLRCTVAGGGTQTVNGYGVANTTGWNINGPLPRDLYWVGVVNNRFNDARNWSTSPSGSPLLSSSDCPPTLDDNVFFISPLADGDNVWIDDVARCNDMTWNITSPATFSGNSAMYVYGDMQFDADMNFTSTSTFYMQGTNANTVFSAGKEIRRIYWNDQSQYTLLDDLNFQFFYLFRHNSFSSGGFDLNGSRLQFRGGGNTDFSGSSITLGDVLPWQMAGHQTKITYDASSRLYLTYNGSALLRIQGWGTSSDAYWPTTEIVGQNPTLTFQDHLKNNDIIVEGDLTVNCDSRFYAEYGSGTADGALRNIEVRGDLNLNPGKIYELGITGTLEVTGDLNAVGPCASDITTIQGINGASYDLDVQGAMNCAYVLIGNANSLSSETLTDCTDLGSNTNITFAPGSGVNTYYWRAQSGSCPSCDYNADWSAPGHWTTNQAATEGSAGCIPGPSDNVVFDANSFNGSSNALVTISTNVTCNDLSVVGSGVRFDGTGNLSIAGNLDSDGSLDGDDFTGTMTFIGATGANTITSNGTDYGCDVVFQNSAGSWALQDNFETRGDLFLNGGTFSTNDHDLTMNRFRSSNTTPRTLNLGASELEVDGNGQWTNFGSISNQFTWDIRDATNLTFNAGTSIIYVTSQAEPVWYSNDVNYHYVIFDSNDPSTVTSPVILGDNNNTRYMKFEGSGRIYGNHRYDTLEFTPNNVYVLESGSTQRLNAPNGTLISDGVPGNEIGIQSTSNGSPAYFFKENTGGSEQSFCFDYISVQDNEAQSDDPAFSFFTGINSDDISATGIWDFTRPFYVQPSMTTGPDVTVCPGGLARMVWDFSGSGPYSISYQIGSGPQVDTTVSNASAQLELTFPAVTDQQVQVQLFTGEYCGSNNDGLLSDSVQWAYTVAPADMAVDQDSAICVLENNDVYTHFVEKDGSDRPMLSIRDLAAGSGLGVVTATTRIDATVQSHNGDVYLQRHYGITPEIQETARIRLYFTQAELDALSTAFGAPLSLSDLAVSKFDNDVLDFSGNASLMTILGTGTADASVTTSSQVRYLEFETSTFSHFLIHPLTFTAPLPVELLSFEAHTSANTVVCEWSTAAEKDNARFEIYRSVDLLEWEFVGETPGAGTSQQTNSYQLTDKNPRAGLSYYRLKQIDFNGQEELFAPAAVELEKPLDVTLYPNPAEDVINVQLGSNAIGNVLFEIYSSTGKRLKRLTRNMKNSNASSFDISELPPGVYTMHVVNGLTGRSNSLQFVVR